MISQTLKLFVKFLVWENLLYSVSGLNNTVFPTLKPTLEPTLEPIFLPSQSSIPIETSPIKQEDFLSKNFWLVPTLFISSMLIISCIYMIRKDKKASRSLNVNNVSNTLQEETTPLSMELQTNKQPDQSQKPSKLSKQNIFNKTEIKHLNQPTNTNNTLMKQENITSENPSESLFLTLDSP